MPVSPEGLRCFLEAARLSSFRAAARRVALSPAALGQQIKRLEDDLGERLFARTTRSVALTESGRALVPYAEKALAALDECSHAANGTAPAAEVELVLGTRHELGMSWIVPMLEKLELEHPALTLHLYFGSGQDLMLRVRAGEIDCAVSSTRLTDPKLDSLKLHEERYVLVGSRELLRATPLAGVAHAKHHTLLDTTAELPLFRYFREAPGGFDSMPFARVVRLGTIDAIRRYVLGGRGVAVLPEYFVAQELKAKKLVRLLPSVKVRSDWFRLVFRSDDTRRSLFESLARQMLKRPLR
jgi:LysR family transcriptional regulator, glycine cleavage system transcriptional activator